MPNQNKIPPPRIDVVELTSGKVTHSVQLHSTSERTVERVMLGMLRNLDTEKYVLQEVLGSQLKGGSAGE